MVRVRSASVMIVLFLRAFLAAVMERSMKSSVAPAGIPRPLA